MILDRRNQLILGGGALALLAGLALAFMLTRDPPGAVTPPPPASRGGLVVETLPTDERLDPARPLRCFVAGQFVGMMTLGDCAKRNGVGSGALDVGVDPSGNLAAAGEAGTVLTPLPPISTATSAPLTGPPPSEAPAAAPAPAKAGPASGVCMRYIGSEWRQLPGEMTLGACAQALFSGRCERRGGASYGRWGQQTLRLLPDRVEISDDNRSFRPLVEQGPGCSVPAFG